MISRVSRGWKIPSWLPMGLLVAVGAAVFWPALTTPFFLDDYLHSAMVHGRYPGVRGPFSLYDFVADDNRQALFDRGFLPWWTDPRLALRFLRPLSSVLLFYEHLWVERWPWVMHVHSFAWWVAAVFAARAFFRRCVRPRAAAFATVIFALSPCHALPIGWLANREALIALAFGTVGLTSLLRWQRGDAHRWGALSLIAFSMALLAGEYAIGCAGYVLAFAWLAPEAVNADRSAASLGTGAPARRPTRRWPSALFFTVPMVLYLVARRALGYGAEASGFYQDPVRDTWLYVTDAPRRLVSLVLAGWFSQDASAWGALWGDAVWPSVVAVAAFVLGGVIALRHVLTQESADLRTMASTLTVGSLLSLFPVLAVLPSARLLGVAMLGIAPVVGLILETAWFGRAAEARRGVEEWTAIVATLLGFAHLVHGPGRGWVNARQIRTYAVEFGEHAADLAKRLEGRDAADIVVVRGLDDVFFYGFALEGLGVRDTHWTVLSHTGHVLCLRHDDASMDLLVGTDAALYPASLGDLYRSEEHPVRAGNTFATGGIVATVSEMDPSGPRKARFDFEAPLDDPRWTWLGESRTRGFYDATPPKIGFGVPFDP